MSSAQPRHVVVSVVVPCHDYGRYLREAVESALSQDVPLEVLIVDDGSTDDSLAVAQALAAADDRVGVHAQPCSGQPAVARNNGIARTSAPYVVCLDADDTLAPGYLRTCVDTLARDPSAAIVYGDVQGFGGDETLHRHLPYEFRRLTHQNLVGTAAMFRRAAWEATGGYAPHLGYEDWDFWIACGERGFTGRYVPEAVFNYRTGHTGRYAGDQRRDVTTKAQIVRRHPRLYTTGEHAWARAVQAGDPVPPSPLGTIPFVAPTLLVPPGGLVVAASTEELAGAPELLEHYDRVAPAGSTLLLHVESQEALRALSPYAERVAADVLAAPGATEADIALQADAVLSRGSSSPLLGLLQPFRLEVAA